MSLTATAVAPVTVRLQYPTANLGLTELQVTPGLVDDMARELFLYSQCHMLAMAVHELTGWPLWVAEQQYDSGAWKWCHLGVQTPAGRWLDIDGPRAATAVPAWLDRWGCPSRLRLVSLPDWYALLGVGPRDAPASWWRTRATAKQYADLVDSFALPLITAGGAS
jgi:hypothetical protein